VKAAKLNKILSVACPVLSLLVVVAVWYALYVKTGSEFLFPSIKTTLVRVWEYLGDPFFWKSLGFTLLRTLSSFGISLVLAVALGVLSWLFSPVRHALTPIIAILRAAPTVAIMVILSFLSTPKQAPIIVATSVIFPMLYASVISGLNQVSPKLVEMSRVYGVSKGKQITGLFLPTVAPYVVGESGAALSFSVKLTVSAEILAYTYESLGGLIQSANVYIDMAGLFALTLVSVVIAFALELALKIIARLLLKRGGAR